MNINKHGVTSYILLVGMSRMAIMNNHKLAVVVCST